MAVPNIRALKSNRLLAALPRGLLDRLATHFDLQPLSLRQVLQPRDRVPENVVFPVNGVASMVALGTSGDAVEVATVGCEGMVGLPVFLGGEKAAAEVFVQVPGMGLFMAAIAFKRYLASEPALNRVLLLYTQALMTQIAQCSACNCYHDVVQRCARWLLQTHDRVPGDEFPLTHEFLGLMLGVRRATVSDAARSLQQRKLIRYHRGAITILDRKGLEQAACGCYRLIDEEFHRLLPRVKPRD